MSHKRFHRLQKPSSWRRLSIANWKAPNDPTVYGTLLIDFSVAHCFLEKINAPSRPRVTVTHLVSKAVALTLKRFPDLNGMIRWKRIYLRQSVDIFLQVAIAEGGKDQKPDLSGTKIESCDTKSLTQIAAELKEKSEKIRQKKDPQFQKTLKLLNVVPALLLSWIIRLMAFLIHNLGINLPKIGLPVDPFGSAMVTSVGMLQVPSGFAPLVPMSRTPLIVCVGEVVERPWVHQGQVVARPILDLSFTLDHRFIDGLTGSRMAKCLKEIIQDPEKHL